MQGFIISEYNVESASFDFMQSEPIWSNVLYISAMLDTGLYQSNVMLSVRQTKR